MMVTISVQRNERTNAGGRTAGKLRALIRLKTLALYKPFTYLLTYLHVFADAVGSRRHKMKSVQL